MPTSVRDVEADRAVVAGEVARDRSSSRSRSSGRPSSPASSSTNASRSSRRRERREPVAVDADDLGRHALADLGLVARLGQDHQAAVAVEVDEPGRDDLAGRVDRPADVGRCRRLRGQEPDPAVADLDGARSAGRARAVDDRPAGDQQVRVVGHLRACSVIGARARPACGRAPRPRGPCRDAPGRSAGEARSAGSSSAGWPLSGATYAGSTAMRSASLPASSEPISVVEPERPRAVKRPQPQPVERAERAAPARRRPSDRRAFWA